jgi:hypothetical protein
MKFAELSDENPIWINTDGSDLYVMIAFIKNKTEDRVQFTVFKDGEFLNRDLTKDTWNSSEYIYHKSSGLYPRPDEPEDYTDKLNTTFGYIFDDL